jgi:hypothetical protein
MCIFTNFPKIPYSFEEILFTAAENHLPESDYVEGIAWGCWKCQERWFMSRQTVRHEFPRADSERAAYAIFVRACRNGASLVEQNSWPVRRGKLLCSWLLRPDSAQSTSRIRVARVRDRRRVVDFENPTSSSAISNWPRGSTFSRNYRPQAWRNRTAACHRQLAQRKGSATYDYFAATYMPFKVRSKIPSKNAIFWLLYGQREMFQVWSNRIHDQ